MSYSFILRLTFIILLQFKIINIKIINWFVANSDIEFRRQVVPAKINVFIYNLPKRNTIYYYNIKSNFIGLYNGKQARGNSFSHKYLSFIFGLSYDANKAKIFSAMRVTF